MASSAIWAQLSSSDDWDYRQALVLHEAFDDSRVSPHMEAVLRRLRAKAGDRFARRPELKDSNDCDGSRPSLKLHEIAPLDRTSVGQL